MRVTLFNPLPRTLGHYEETLRETLGRIGVSATTFSPAPATDSSVSHLARARAHLAGVRRTRSEERLIALWPAFGWLEPAIWEGARGCLVIVHDPAPIRRQYGYGRLARAAGRIALDHSGPGLICHTEAAREEVMRAVGPARAPALCLHPIATPAPKQEVATKAPRSTPVVLVAGQYKPTRDVRLLSTLGPILRSAGFRPRIVGRGWPQLADWEVRDGFLSEADFDLELGGASVLLVPYRRYWQSGVALRALENGTDVVGARTEFLAKLLGADHPGLIDGDPDARAWLVAVEATVDGSSRLDERRRVYKDAVDESWASLFERLC
jgi:hypothetical protein